MDSKTKEAIALMNLAKSEHSVRISVNGRWMYYDGDNWIVRTQEYRKKSTTVLAETKSIDTAIAILTN